MPRFQRVPSPKPASRIIGITVKLLAHRHPFASRFRRHPKNLSAKFPRRAVSFHHVGALASRSTGGGTESQGNQ